MPEVPWPKTRRVQDANGWGNHDVLEHDQTLFPLDDETRALYERATTGQSSLSDADRQKLSQLPSQGAQDSHYRKQCGLTRSELIAKAVQDPGSLSYFEASLIITPAMDPGLSLQRHRVSKIELYLLDTVLEAVLTKEEIAARQISLDMKGFWDQQSGNAKETRRDNDRQIIEETMTVQWQEYIMGLSDHKLASCGFVIFHSKDLDWPVFKEQMETAIRHGFNFMSGVKTAIKDRLAIHETKCDDSKSLQSRFTAMQDERAIPKGLQSNAFLYVDDKTLQSRHSAAKDRYQAHSTGTDCTVDATGYVIDKGRTWPWRNTSDLEQLHAEAGPSRNSDGERDRIWPPTPRQFQIQSSGSFDNELRIECVATC
ncbi:hypothetical protein FOCG_11416 [Fusarium oxysporum f. sp. radicis-lycopersici 26381]|nr:hypothetical protein FOCG_11416 [Fusarium oxysporum f. sp. radicis-lycopersici 26381]